MKFWFEMTDVKFVTIDYGRYEAVRFVNTSRHGGIFTWTPVLAGPQPA